MFWTLIYPSSGACDCVDELPHRSSCSQFVVFVVFGLLQTTKYQPQQKLQHTKNWEQCAVLFFIPALSILWWRVFLYRFQRGILPSWRLFPGVCLYDSNVELAWGSRLCFRLKPVFPPPPLPSFDSVSQTVTYFSALLVVTWLLSSTLQKGLGNRSLVINSSERKILSV